MHRGCAEPPRCVLAETCHEKQRERLALFLPTEFSNLDIDSRGFIMATTRPGSVYQEDVVRRLSAVDRMSSGGWGSRRLLGT